MGKSKLDIKKDLNNNYNSNIFFSNKIILSEKDFNNINKKINIFLNFLVFIEKYAIKNKNSDIFKRLFNSLSSEGQTIFNWTENKKVDDEYMILNRFRRIDAFYTNKKFNIIEINQSAPLALSFYEEARIFSNNKDKKKENKNSLSHELINWFYNSFKHFYGEDLFFEKQKITIGLSIEKGYPVKFIDLPRISKIIEKNSLNFNKEIEIIIFEPQYLRLNNKKELLVKNKKIDLIWRNTVYLSAYKKNQMRDYLYIMQNQDKFLVINSTQSWLTRSKELLAIIWDDSYINLFLKNNINILKIRKFIPETYSVSKINIDNFKKNKKHWIIKPTDSGFGKDIIFGKNLSTNEWVKCLKNNNYEKFVIQKVVKPQKTQMIINKKQNLFELDFNPFIINGKLSKNILIRGLEFTKNKKVMNIVNGAYIGDVFIKLN
jgi:hypothetical protein